MLKTHITQVAQQAATAAPACTFPGQPQPNSKGHVNAITHLSGTTLNEPVDLRLQNLTMYQKPSKATRKDNEPKVTENEKEDKSEEV